MNFNAPISTEQKMRVSDAAAAIASLSDVYDRTPVVFFKTLDNLLIGFGEPCALRITDSAGDRSFQTAPLELTAAGPPIEPFGSELRFEIISTRRSDACEDIVGRGTAFLEGVGQTLVREHAENVPRLIHSLGDGFRQVCSSHDAPPPAAEPVEGVSRADAAQRVEPVFERLEAFLLAHNHRFHLPHKPDQSRFLFFHRFLGSSGRPEVYLHLLQSQRKAILEGAGLSTFDAVEAALVHVFSPGNWMIDERLNTGVSGWTDWPWHGSSSDDVAQAESLLTSTLFASSDDLSGTLRSALVIPIHVDGLPWLAMAGMFGVEEEAPVLWGQRFYRDLLPYLTTTIRAEAERAYLGALRDIARTDTRLGCVDPALITKDLGTLAATFPYQRIVASTADAGDADAIEWVGRTRLALGYGDGNREAQRVNYGRLNKAGVVAAFADGRNEAAAERAQSLEAQLLTYMDVGHTLKNVVECTGWAIATENVGRVANYFEAMVQAGLTEADIEEIGTALGFADRSLSLFWIMSSLGHFIRLSGANTGSYGWDKFSEWIDPASRDADASIFASNYIEAVSQIATALAYGAGWSSVVIRNADGSECRQWAGAPPDPLDVKGLHLPPFKKGADVGYVFAFCLLEPLLNALRALGALPPGMLDGESPPPLEIAVSPNAADHSVNVTILNLSPKKLPPTLSGLRSARAIATDIGLATFLDPKEELLESGLYRITSGVSFHPSQIIEAITQAAS